MDTVVVAMWSLANATVARLGALKGDSTSSKFRKTRFSSGIGAAEGGSGSSQDESRSDGREASLPAMRYC